jgi:hypothetical protein
MIDLNFNYSRQDCVRAWRRHFREKLNLPLDLAVVILLAALGLFQWYANGLGVVVLVLLGLSTALALIVALALFVIPQLAYQRNDKLKQAYHLQFSEDAICFKTRSVDSRLEWGLYSRLLIDCHSYLLYYGKDVFSIVPKRVIPDADVRQSFERLLERKLKTIIRR